MHFGHRSGCQNLLTVSGPRGDLALYRIYGLMNIEICYQLKYIEKNDHKQGARWSERQVGVYHRFGKGEKAILILLHTSPSTELQRRIENLFPNEKSSIKELLPPLVLHVLILSTYLDNWRWALQDYAQRCTQKVRKIIASSGHG